MDFHNYKLVEFSTLIGMILTKIDVKEDSIDFYTECGKTYRMEHFQDCCEEVYIEDICGMPVQNLIGDRILIADERTNSDDQPSPEYNYSFTWTFYELATIKGAITIRWFGTSTGWYSEEVSFYEI